jgi:hypothetical protein
MIPQRRVSNENCGNGFKGRVTACRKRLRVNRRAQRVQVNNAAEELAPETSPLSRFDHSAAERPLEFLRMPASVGRMSCREPGNEILLLVSEQEVGVT